NGTLDGGFGTGGKVTTLIGTDARAFAVALQPDGRIVVAGSAASGGDSNMAIVRYSTGGVPDPTFGAGGVLNVPVGTAGSAAEAVAIQPDGKIVVAGEALDGTGPGVGSFAVLRFSAGGIFDPTFGSG